MSIRLCRIYIRNRKKSLYLILLICQNKNMFNPINDVDIRISGYRNSGIIFAIMAKFAHRWTNLIMLYLFSYALCTLFFHSLNNQLVIIFISGNLVFILLVLVWFLISY